MTKKLYLAVTPDKYELPLIVADTPKELARYTDKHPCVVLSLIKKDSKNAGAYSGFRFKRVEVEVYDDEKHLFERW